MKVYELSKELNIDTKELIAKIKTLQIDVKNHLSVIDDEQVDKIKNYLNSNDENKDFQPKKSTVTKTVKWEPDLTRSICIKNISRGRLVYKSKRQLGYTIIWDKRNDTNYMELGEFINLKNSDLRFLTEPWIRIIEDDEVEILKYANVYQYFKDMIEINDIEDIFKYDFEKFKKKFDKLPEGYKKSVAEHSAQMIKEGRLDSIKIKNYIEESLEIDLDVLSPSVSKEKSTSININ